MGTKYSFNTITSHIPIVHLPFLYSSCLYSRWQFPPHVSHTLKHIRPTTVQRHQFHAEHSQKDVIIQASIIVTKEIPYKRYYIFVCPRLPTSSTTKYALYIHICSNLTDKFVFTKNTDRRAETR